MQVNHDYDLSKPLQSALRGKAPYVGIPIPGYAPLTLERGRLAQALKGVTPINIEVIIGSGGERYLLVEGYAGDRPYARVRTRMKMLSKRPGWWMSWEGRRVLDAWHKAEFRKRRLTVPIPIGADRKAAAKIKQAAVALRRLHKEFADLGSPVTLRNPAVPYIPRSDNSEYHTDERHGEREYCEQRRMNWKEMRESKRLRTIIGAIAVQARRENWTTRRLYKELTDHGIAHQTLSSLKPKERERRGADTVHDYLWNLWKFCRGSDRITGREYSGYAHNCRYQASSSEAVGGRKRRLSDGQEWGPERYMRKLADMQERRALQEHIASVESLIPATPVVSVKMPVQAAQGNAAELAA